MRVLCHVEKHPFVLMFLLGLALQTIGNWRGVLYDSGGAESLLFFYLPLLFAFPVWIAHEMLSSFEFAHALYFSKWVAVALGFFIALGLDYLLSTVLAAIRGNRSAA